MVDSLAPAPILEIAGLSISFGGIRALEGLDFTVHKDQITGLIGPNGSGKSTLFNCISGFYRPHQGDIRLDRQSLLHKPAHAIAGLGIARTFQNIELFKSLSVLDNLVVASDALAGGGSMQLFRRGISYRSSVDQAREILAFLQIEEHENEMVTGLPYGVQKLVELGRALMRKPKLILLDEPAAGAHHSDLIRLKSLIRRVRNKFSTTVFLIEHNLSLIMELCERILVLNFGKKIAEGAPNLVRQDPAVVAAYLGSAPA